MLGSNESFSLARCNNCGHVYLNPRPVPEDILRYYPADYAPHHNSLELRGPDASESSPKPAWYLSPVVRAVPGLRSLYYWLTDSGDVAFPICPRETPPPRVLELGCSDGDYLLQLKQRGWETVGIEPARQPAQRARERGLDVHCGTLQPGQFPPSHFDAVCAWHVVEHLHEPKAVVEEVARILRPGGQLLLSVPNFGCWERRFFGKYWYSLQPPIHLQQFTERSMRRLLEATGFQDIVCEYQRNLSNVVGSIALWLRHRGRVPRLAERLYQYPDNPTLSGQLALALPARLLAACRQGGRMTFRARRSG